MSSLHGNYSYHGKHVTTRITITGAAGRIAYSLIPLILNGLVFGNEHKIYLSLLDIPECAEKLNGVKMEIQDSNYRLLDDLFVTTNPNDAFIGTDVAILLGGIPRIQGMERKDLLIKNAESIRSQALALNNTAHENVKVLVVANPANTNCLVAIKTATNIPATNFTCLTRLDEERLRNFCSEKVMNSSKRVSLRRITGDEIQNVYILGNHSTTQVAHISDGIIHVGDHTNAKVHDYFNEEEYNELLRRLQNRGGEIINATKLSSASSAAEAIVKHLRDWLGSGSSSGPFSMGVYSQGNPYGINNDLVFSFPCVKSFDNSSGYKILPGVSMTKVTELVKKSEQELLDEREQIRDFLN